MTQSVENWQESILTENATIKDVIESLDRTCNKIVMIVNNECKLVGTIADGDIRRSLLKGYGIQSPARNILHENPLVVHADIGRTEILRLMKLNRVQQIPIVDSGNRIVGLYVLEDLVSPPKAGGTMVIMAGGKGKRLLPHTQNCPKPLLTINGKPMLGHILDRAKDEGFDNFIISLGYLGEMIEDFFGDGERFGVQIRYVREDSPLGTAGALSLMRDELSDAPFIVTNGDVITDIRYRELLDFHTDQGAAATMAVRLHEWQNPFGVVQTNGIDIIGFEEKPFYQCNVNAGVYALNHDSLQYLVHGAPCDMPDFFELLKSKTKRVIAYAVHEEWQDIGRPEDLMSAQAKLQK